MVLAGRVLPTFTGGLAVVDVRDVAEAVVRATELAPLPESCLLVGANVGYKDVLTTIAAAFGRSVSLIPVPRVLAAAAGLFLDALPTNHPMSLAHGLMSGWRCYYDSTLSVKTIGHTYRGFEQTIADGCRYFLDTFKPERR
jgi:uncharacterized protein YbjT (DUF2867 family)